MGYFWLPRNFICPSMVLARKNSLSKKNFMPKMAIFSTFWPLKLLKIGGVGEVTKKCIFFSLKSLINSNHFTWPTFRFVLVCSKVYTAWYSVESKKITFEKKIFSLIFWRIAVEMDKSWQSSLGMLSVFQKKFWVCLFPTILAQFCPK